MTEQRVSGYFSLPVMIDDEIVSVVDLEIDHQAKKLLLQKWTWLPNKKSTILKEIIEPELHSFEKFQLQTL